MIKYLYDENGNKTDIVIPIEQLNNIKSINESLKRFDPEEHNKLSESFKLDDLVNKKAIFKQHYLEILKLISLFHMFSKENNIEEHKMKLYDPQNDLMNTYKEYFKYYEILNQEDINLLYFFRSEVFKGFNTTDEVDNYCNILYDKYQLKDRHANICLFSYNDLIEQYNTLTEFSFLQYFKMNHTIVLPKSNIKRLNRDTECTRLFIYDLMTINEKYAGSLQAIINYWSFVQDKSSLIEYLADMFYKGTKTSVHRAYKEAKEKIQQITI